MKIYAVTPQQIEWATRIYWPDDTFANAPPIETINGKDLFLPATQRNWLIVLLWLTINKSIDIDEQYFIIDVIDFMLTQSFK